MDTLIFNLVDTLSKTNIHGSVAIPGESWFSSSMSVAATSVVSLIVGFFLNVLSNKIRKNNDNKKEQKEFLKNINRDITKFASIVYGPMKLTDLVIIQSKDNVLVDKYEKLRAEADELYISIDFECWVNSWVLGKEAKKHLEGIIQVMKKTLKELNSRYCVTRMQKEDILGCDSNFKKQLQDYKNVKDEFENEITQKLIEFKKYLSKSYGC